MYKRQFRNHAVDATIEFYRKPWLQHPTKYIKGDDASASSPTYYFTGYGRRQLLHHPLQQNTAAGAAEPEQPCHEQVLFPAGVDTPQHSQADTCAGAQPRKKTAKGNSPAHIQLSQQHAGTAVGYKTCLLYTSFRLICLKYISL